MRRFLGLVTSRIAVLICVLFVFTLTHAQDSERDVIGVKKAVAVRASDSIQVDGFLTDADWQSSPTIGELLQREPREGAPPSETTEVRLIFDDVNLYIGVICHDSNPNAIIATQMSRDADLSVDDRIELLLDTFLDRRHAFYFSH
jgi:hypothetical protein